MTVNEKSIYLVDGGDYQIYCLGYTEARTVTNEILRCDPWGGIPFVLSQDFEMSFGDKGNVVMTKNTLEKILKLASDDLPKATEESFAPE